MANTVNTTPAAVRSGEVYYIKGDRWMLQDGEPTKGGGVFANRPAVIISKDACNQDQESVFVTFTTRKAHESVWYQKFSPQQVDVQFDGRISTALCSHPVLVDKKRLGKRMGSVSREELERITNAVRKSRRMDSHLHVFLYQPEGEEPTP